MSEKARPSTIEINSLTKEQKLRAKRANEVYQQIFDKVGIKASTFANLQGWKDYVAGNITESELSEDAGKDLREFAKGAFGLLDTDEEDPARLTDSERNRAKKANEIYREVCNELGLNSCFFSNFAAWKEFVEKDISEEEFCEKVMTEARRTFSEATLEQ